MNTDQATLQQALRDRCLALKPGTSFRLSAGEVRETSGYTLVHDIVKGAGCEFYVGAFDYIVYKEER